MDSQFRCGKCSKPASSKYTKCLECGFLGPHNFNAQSDTDFNGEASAQPSRNREQHSADRIERQQSQSSPVERYSDPQPYDSAEEAPRTHISHSKNDDLRFPAGMQHRSPILDHIDYMGKNSDNNEPRKKHITEKNRDAKESDSANRSYSFYEDDEKEEEKPKKDNTSSLTSTIMSIVLVLALAAGALYVINNFEEITQWLASPTIPEFIKPSEGQSSNTSSDNPNTITAPTTAPSNPALTPPATSPPTGDTTKPVISDIVIGMITDRGATISWKTSEPCTSKVLFKTEIGALQNHNVSTTLSSSHSIALTDLESGKNYYVTIQCQDAAGNISPLEKTFQTLTVVDNTPPKLIGQPLVTANESNATISWKTDEKAISLVKYGNTASYQYQSGITSPSNINSSIFLSGLSPDTIYHYQLISRDAAGNEMTSPDFTFKTEGLTNSAPYMGNAAPNFTLKTLDGKDLSLSQFRGKKVILNFWASWCSPCKIELPHLQSIWNNYANKDIMLLTVAGSQSDEAELRSYYSSNNFTFAVCLDPGDNVFNKYEISSIPRTYFLDKSGVIRRLQQGMFTSVGEIEFILNSY